MFKIKYHSSRLFNFLTVIILSGLCVLLNNLTRINFHRLELPKNKPEFSATGILANLYNPEGKLLYKVMAESSIEYPDSDRVLFSMVKLQAFTESTDDIQQQLSSDDGWIETSSSLGFLGKKVILTINNPDSKQTIFVNTENVHLNAVTKFASSSAPVRATQGKSVITGNGFSLDYEKKFLTIESNVKVIYDK